MTGKDVTLWLLEQGLHPGLLTWTLSGGCALESPRSCSGASWDAEDRH